jgi:WD40 repeat protein
MAAEADTGDASGIRQPEVGIQPDTYQPRTLRYDLQTRSRLPFPECLDISLALTTALAHLHRHGLVHRDIKPTNIVFVNGIPKLADIGTVAGVSERTVGHSGSPGYAPSEGLGSPQADIYSLGRVMYEMMTGKDRTEFPALPSGFEAWAEHDRWLEFNAVVRRAAAPKAEERYAKADDLHKDLVLVQAGEFIQRQQLLEWRLKVARWGLALLAVVAVIVGSGFWNEASARKERERESALRSAERLRIGERRGNWSSNAISWLAQAGRIRVNDDLRNQVAATFSGLDAVWVAENTNQSGASICWDASGTRLALGSAGDGRSAILAADGLPARTIGGREPSAAWFGADGICRELAVLSNAVVVLAFGGPERTRFALPDGIEPSLLTKDVTIVVAENGRFGGVCWRDGRRRKAFLGLFDLKAGKFLQGLPGNWTSFAFSAQGDCLVAGTGEGEVRAFSLPEVRELGRPLRVGRAAVSALAVKADCLVPAGEVGAEVLPAWLVAAGDEAGCVRLFDLPLGSIRTICPSSYHVISFVLFHPDNMTLISGGRAELRFWDVASGRLLLRFGGCDFALAAAVDPTGRRLAVTTDSGFGNTSGRTQVIALEPGRGVHELRAFAAQASQLRFSDDGRRVAALSHGWEVAVWDVASQRLLQKWEAPPGWSADNAALLFSADGQRLFFATSEAVVEWEVGSGRVLDRWPMPAGLVQSLWRTPDGQTLHFQWDARNDRVCRMRRLQSGGKADELWPWDKAKGRVLTASFAFDGQALFVEGQATTNHDSAHLAVLLDPLTGQVITNLPSCRDDNGMCALGVRGDWFSYRVTTNAWLVMRGTAGAESWVFPHGAYAVSQDGLFVVTGEGMTTGGLGLWRRGQARPALVLAPDQQPWLMAEFTPNGRWLAWTTTEGVVILADLPEVFRRMERWGSVPRR